MILYPHAKINLGLNILTKRSDSYHSIESLFLPINLVDLLEFKESDADRFTLSGLPLDSSFADNLVWKMIEQIRAEFAIPPLEIHLHKQIPFGAGLGGGSSDAAFMLRGINDYFQLNLNEEQLLQNAINVGSDCPFFLKSTAQFAKGRGEELSVFPNPVKDLKLLLIIPPFSISTPKAYADLQLNTEIRDLKSTLKKPIQQWKKELKNDFEFSVFKDFPILDRLKKELYKAGAIYVSLSGSGSALYGLFPEKKPIDLKTKMPFYWLDFL